MVSQKSSHQEVQSLLILNALGLWRRRAVFEELEKDTTPSDLVEQIKTKNLWGKRDRMHKLLKTFSPERELAQCNKQNIRIVSILDPAYPPLLANIYDPPLVLYVKGHTEALREKSVAIVGTRVPSFYGNKHAKGFASFLAQQGVTVVSGLAQGIDQQAHNGSLQSDHAYAAVGVLGCGVDVNYPSRSVDLKTEIIKRGALVSEYPLGTEPRSYSFPERNRIISGLSSGGVLVVEAHTKSGSLITAHTALDQDRTVFAIPGPIDQETSGGTNVLIQQGAILVTHPLQIIEAMTEACSGQSEFRWKLDRLQHQSGTEDEATPSSVGLSEDDEILLKNLAKAPLTYEEFLEATGLPQGRFFRALASLEIQGIILKQPEGCFSLST